MPYKREYSRERAERARVAADRRRRVQRVLAAMDTDALLRADYQILRSIMDREQPRRRYVCGYWHANTRRLIATELQARG